MTINMFNHKYGKNKKNIIKEIERQLPCLDKKLEEELRIPKIDDSALVKYESLFEKDRVRKFNRSVNMSCMLNRDDYEKCLDLDPTRIKLKRNGYDPITGKFSLVDYSESKDDIKEKYLANFSRMDKG